ncbi:MAG: hypothetical protein O7B81_07125, partial [Gammaproteobacteria bacterium]|nr:hypothetical protein [Gammaproteobacteria bacterium]
MTTKIKNAIGQSRRLAASRIVAVSEALAGFSRRLRRAERGVVSDGNDGPDGALCGFERVDGRLCGAVSRTSESNRAPVVMSKV